MICIKNTINQMQNGNSRYTNIKPSINTTYDHRTLKTRLPVRSALFKQRTGGLVVRWVTTSEYPLLYVFGIVFVLCDDGVNLDDKSRGGLIHFTKVVGRCGCNVYPNWYWSCQDPIDDFCSTRTDVNIRHYPLRQFMCRQGELDETGVNYIDRHDHTLLIFNI